MPSTGFPCPRCHTVLQLVHAVPSRKQIHCPRCDMVFAAPETDYPTPSDEPVLAVTYASDDDERFERKRHSRQTLLIGAGIGVGVLVLALGGLLFWLLRSSDNKGTGNEDPLAYVPPNSGMIVNLDMGRLMDHPTIGPLVHGAILAQKQDAFVDIKQETGLEFRDLCDKVIVADQQSPSLGMIGPRSRTLILRSRIPFQQDQIRRSVGNTTRHTLGGKTYFTVEGRSYQTLFMPSDRLLVVSDLPAGKMAESIGSDGVRPLLDPEVVDRTRQFRRGELWMVIPVTNALRAGVHLQVTEHNTKPIPQEIQPLMEAFKHSKAIAFCGVLAGEQVQLELALVCNSDPAAREVVDVVQKLWQKRTRGWAGLQAMIGMAMVPAETRKAVMELLKATDFHQNGPVAQASTLVSLDTLLSLFRPK